MTQQLATAILYLLGTMGIVAYQFMEYGVHGAITAVVLAVTVPYTLKTIADLFGMP